LKVDAGGIEANIGQDGALGGPFTLSWAVAPHTLFSRRVTVAVTWSDQRAVARGTPNKVEFSSITRGIFHE
ncbi:MAG: hypothetical protein KJP07_07940, partial [Desulfatitalea sp.]|nr:hypothetical protein [Desulfatitalea sp.]